MNNVIFGSGIVGLAAKALLPTWRVIPFYRSRFFSYNPALDDNFVTRDAELDPFVRDLTKSDPKIYFYKRAFSVGPQLIPQWDGGLCHDWLVKIFGSKYPQHAEAYLSSRMVSTIYDIKVNKLYESLLNQYMKELKAESSKGMVTEIGDHYYVRNGKREDFDNAISTIPLDVLCKLAKLPLELESKPLYLLHVKTDSLDFEGNNQLLVVDQVLDFFRVTNVAANRYMFYCHRDIANPGAYFLRLGLRFEILDGTRVDSAIPLGSLPRLAPVEALGVNCVGSYAEWDWCADVGSCLLRLLRLAQRNFQPRQMKSI